jgi:phage shock protein A
MASLLQKLRTLFKANLHDLADKALEKNSLAVYDQYIRQAEQEIQQFRTTITPIFAQVQTARRRREALATEAAKLDLAIDRFLQQGKKTEALVAQRKFASTMKLIQSWDRSLERQVRGAETLQDIFLKLEGRLDIARQERSELAMLLEMAKAKEISANAMRSLDALMGQGDHDLARAAESIRRRLDHADAAWELQTESLGNQLDDTLQNLELEADLAARMERLGIQ